MGRYAVIELEKEELKFSAGHFMVLSPTERESLHGHDYQLHILFKTLIEDNGMAFDCRLYKKKLATICQSLDYRFILPKHSKFLQVIEDNAKWVVKFRDQTIPFLKADAVVLPIANVTLEELSLWFLDGVDLRPGASSGYGHLGLM